MKTTILVLSFILFSIVASAQKTPPTVVSRTFKQMFKNAEKVKWAMEESTEWEAEFKLSGKATSASFDLAGKWLETESEMEANQLPAKVKTAIEKEYKGAKMGEASKIETPDFKGYEIAMKQNGESFEIHATNDGKLTKTNESK